MKRYSIEINYSYEKGFCSDDTGLDDESVITESTLRVVVDAETAIDAYEKINTWMDEKYKGAGIGAISINKLNICLEK